MYFDNFATIKDNYHFTIIGNKHHWYFIYFSDMLYGMNRDISDSTDGDFLTFFIQIVDRNSQDILMLFVYLNDSNNYLDNTFECYKHHHDYFFYE